METKLKYIGLIDKSNNVHGVELKAGLNIITGRSSTGKSALIEIFDYCMGAETSTIPKGKITEEAAVFFLLLEISGLQWVIGHSADHITNFYLSQDSDIKSEKELNLEYFNEARIVKPTIFKHNLGRIFGLTFINEKQKEDKEEEKSQKKRPSVRNMMSYILQHQNLIANKLALFYRFDEYEKKIEVIDQFKIFSGFVDAQYFEKTLQIELLEKEISKISIEKEREDKRKESVEKKIAENLSEYKEITDEDLLDITGAKYIVEQAEIVKKKIQEIPLEEIIVMQKKEDAQYVRTYDSLLKQKNELHAQIRSIQLKLQDYEDSIQYVENYKAELKGVKGVKKARVEYSICPFCKQHTNVIDDEVKGLVDSINRLNDSIKAIPFLNDELYGERTKARGELDKCYRRLEILDNQIQKIKKIIAELRNNRSLKEQGFKKMMEIESSIDVILDIKHNDVAQRLLNKQADLYKLQGELKSKYDLNDKMSIAAATIEQYMEEYRKMLAFEVYLNDWKMKFDLKKFELYFENFSGEKTMLRSIGSGRNWLNAHLCLFLAMSRYFYEIPNSKMPRLLFIDQPSQVYFPTKDRGDEFNATQLVDNMEGKLNSNDKQEEEERKKMVADDIQEVTNIFNTLYKFTQDVNNGVQVIVTEHADNLDLDNVEFNSLVRARWRKSDEGLIMNRASKGDVVIDEQGGII